MKKAKTREGKASFRKFSTARKLEWGMFQWQQNREWEIPAARTRLSQSNQTERVRVDLKKKNSLSERRYLDQSDYLASGRVARNFRSKSKNHRSNFRDHHRPKIVASFYKRNRTKIVWIEKNIRI